MVCADVPGRLPLGVREDQAVRSVNLAVWLSGGIPPGATIRNECNVWSLRQDYGVFAGAQKLEKHTSGSCAGAGIGRSDLTVSRRG